MEKPILKGAFRNTDTVQIDYVHPTVTGAAAFQYQIWPLDKSSMWYAFLKTLSPQGPITHEMSDVSAKSKLVAGAVMMQKNQSNVQEIQMNTILEKQKVQGKKEAKRQRAELERQRAREKKEAKQRKIKTV